METPILITLMTSRLAKYPCFATAKEEKVAKLAVRAVFSHLDIKIVCKLTAGLELSIEQTICVQSRRIFITLLLGQYEMVL